MFSEQRCHLGTTAIRLLTLRTMGRYTVRYGKIRPQVIGDRF